METREAHVYVFDTLADWEVGYAIAQLNTPLDPAARGRYRVVSVGTTRAPVRTLGGLTITPDLALDEIDPARSALLILPGGNSWDAGGNLEAIDKARAFVTAGVPVAAICGATGGLARAGLLDACAHTSNAKEYLQYQPGYGGATRYREAPAVRDRGIITAGSTAPVEFAREIFAALELFRGPVLEAWYGLFSSGDARYYRALMQAISPDTPLPGDR